MSRLKNLLSIATSADPSHALSQELVMLAFDAGRKQVLKKGIRVSVKLNKKNQVSYISNYAPNATVIMDE